MPATTSVPTTPTFNSVRLLVFKNVECVTKLIKLPSPIIIYFQSQVQDWKKS